MCTKHTHTDTHTVGGEGERGRGLQGRKQINIKTKPQLLDTGVNKCPPESEGSHLLYRDLAIFGIFKVNF